MLCAPNMIEALKLSASFAHVHAAYYQVKILSTADGVQVQLIELADLGDTQEFQTEVLMQMVQNLIEAVLGTEFNSGHFYFPYQAPAHAEKYGQYFHSSCEFNSEHAALEIPLPVLQTSSPFYDPTAWQTYQLKLEQLLNKLNKDSAENSELRYSQHVKSFLSASALPLPNVEEAAANLNITSRSLSRHLKKEGSSFRDIRNELLKEYAEFYLKESDMTVDAIACQLGYKDFSSFRRAFKSWYGCSPVEFRNNN